MSNLSSHSDPPTLKNHGFMEAGARFSKHPGLGPQDAFAGVLGLSWAPFGSSWGSLGDSLEPLHQPQMASRFLLELSWTSVACFLLLLVVSFRFSFFDVVFYLLTERLGVDAELPNNLSDPQTP